MVTAYGRWNVRKPTGIELGDAILPPLCLMKWMKLCSEVMTHEVDDSQGVILNKGFLEVWTLITCMQDSL